MVECDDYTFFIGIEYENLPAFCDYCHISGHEVSNCSRQKKDSSKPSKKNQRKQGPK